MTEVQEIKEIFSGSRADLRTDDLAAIVPTAVVSEQKLVLSAESSVTVAERWKLYLDERNNRSTLFVSVSQGLDKYLTSLPAAALALSVTIRWNIHSAVDSLWALYFCWALFIVALILMLLSMIFGVRAFQKELDDLDAQYHAELIKEEFKASPNKWNELTVWFEGIAAAAFVIGLVSLLLFAVANAPK